MLARYQKSRPKRWQGNLHVPKKKKKTQHAYMESHVIWRRIPSMQTQDAATNI